MQDSKTSAKSDYPYNGWEIIEDEFNIKNNYKNETIFSLGNGYIGMRGNFEENYKWDDDIGLSGTYINGFYESETIKYGEAAYGYAENSQTMLNVDNGKIIKLYLEDEEFSMLTGKIIEYKRVLDLKKGILKRHILWRSIKGHEICIDIERLVSFSDKHLAAINYEVIPLNFSGGITIESMIDGDVANLTSENDPRVGSGLRGRVLKLNSIKDDGSFGSIIQNTINTKFYLACAMENELTTECKYAMESNFEGYICRTAYHINGEIDKKIKLSKYISYITSLDCSDESIGKQARDVVLDAKRQGFDNIYKNQIKYMEDFWYRADVSIEGDLRLEQGLRFNMFHLLQSAGRGGSTNIAAKGLTGEGYEGHYFWDTENFMLPFFLYTCPDIAKGFLKYRYGKLNKARERARQMAHKKGALYPWRTIGGEECSAYYPAGTAQYHIDADIALAVKRYVDVTGDYEFLIEYGAEILFETARLWVDLGSFIEHKGGKFCINGVTGPDEYTAIVNNNCYTNLMARENLHYAYDIAIWLKNMKPKKYTELVLKLGLSDDELYCWKRAADNMYIPYDKDAGIYLQDDAFLDRAPWDFEHTPKENYPLLLHYHPLVIYRHQVSKQADLILAMFLLGDKFSSDEKKVNYDFYERFATHDSSLSKCIFSIMACEAGYMDKSFEYFTDTIRMDLDDSNGNTRDGAHMANMAGAWLCLTNGFAGMRMYDNKLGFYPHIPEDWVSYSFKINYRHRLIKVTVSHERTSCELLEGENLNIFVDGKEVVLQKME